ncbi:hypothetical protein NDU88_001027 [Pleurodeles waltl]|uniref:Uncharacterized protein n=1 Tax=Pleurodeles waltl TaxID=8319 RepID=A0AAV7W088_PLEWA|nr:hypothetical protein NDU88_001027 [Pleurodeles waltl]
MVHRVQEWEVANQSVFRAGEQVEFRDEQGAVLRGTICGVSSEDGSAGSAQVRLDFWQQDPRAYCPGCEAAHVSGGHRATSVHQRFGRPAGGQVPVEVRAPPGHRLEERAQSGAVRLTARDSASRDGGSLDPILSVHETFSDSRSAISGVIAEEELDYEEDIPGSGEQAVAVHQATTSGQAVQGDRLSGRRDVAANLRRGEVSRKYDRGLVIAGDSRTVVRPIKNVDVAIQAGEGVKESKSEGSTGTAQEVAEIPWACTGSGCTEDGGSQGIMGIRRVRMLQLVQQSVALSTRKSYTQAWLEFLRSGAVKQEGGVEACEKPREEPVQFIMRQIEMGLLAVTISGCVGGPDGGCNVWIVGHSFVRWVEKQAASRHFGKQLGLDGARIKISWVVMPLVGRSGWGGGFARKAFGGERDDAERFEVREVVARVTRDERQGKLQKGGSKTDGEGID